MDVPTPDFHPSSTMAVVNFVLIISGIICLVNGACYYNGQIPNFDIPPEETFCEYMGERHPYGSVFLTPDCKNCTCEAYGSYPCCDYGAALIGVVGLPEWCKWEINGCDAKAILKDHPSEHCFGEPIFP